ncbi:hypothetical protein J2S00_002336 [Caldalkalibacillus uzonensis]|uniref:Uncharacterized protein n=1 Tax=Caldalkalibacillus uzonensis TaxID=353224 RepID=A0ABU0CT06_9BACI|nr:hypothetical protein [Caldalkalibacillus uzonensis]MDQ0339548.1 hypothetical protein [Caldalkalibacillus uzonensis]
MSALTESHSRVQLIPAGRTVTPPERYKNSTAAVVGSSLEG